MLTKEKLQKHINEKFGETLFGLETHENSEIDGYNLISGEGNVIHFIESPEYLYKALYRIYTILGHKFLYGFHYSLYCLSNTYEDESIETILEVVVRELIMEDIWTKIVGRGNPW